MKATGLLRLYPRAWRERYGEELQALIDEAPIGASAELDLILGAAREWVHLGASKLTGQSRAGSAGPAMQCPQCKTNVGFDDWLRMKAQSGPVAGHAVRECGSCGTLIRLTRSWSVARSLSCALMLIYVATDFPGIRMSHVAVVARVTLISVVLVASVIASRSVRLETVPLDYGEAK